MSVGKEIRFRSLHRETEKDFLGSWLAQMGMGGWLLPMISLIRHQRQERVPRQVRHVYEEELEAQGNEGEVDELERRPDQAVREVGRPVDLLGVGPRALPNPVPLVVLPNFDLVRMAFLVLGLVDQADQVADQSILLLLLLRTRRFLDLFLDLADHVFDFRVRPD